MVSPKSAQKRLGKAGALVLVIGVILFLPFWSDWQNARDKSNSPPGRIFTSKGEVLKVVFSPDGQRLASSGGIYKGRGNWVTGEINSWDPLTGQLLLAFAGHPKGVTDLDFSPDGKRLASASSDGIKIWDAATGKQLLTLSSEPNEEPCRVAFQPQGTSLATVSVIGPMWRGDMPIAVKVWIVPPIADGELPTPVFSYPCKTSSSIGTGWRPPTLTFSPDGTRLACGQGKNVLIWDFRADRQGDNTSPSRALEGHTGPVCDQVFSPDGKRLATASDDETIRIWDPATGEELLAFKSPREGIPGYRGIRCLAFSPDGKRLAGGKAQNLAIWDAATGQELYFLRWHSQSIESLAYSPDGKTLATGAGDHDIKLWDLAALEHWTGVGPGEN
jgi:WD40 repeat protein